MGVNSHIQVGCSGIVFGQFAAVEEKYGSLTSNDVDGKPSFGRYIASLYKWDNLFI